MSSNIVTMAVKYLDDAMDNWKLVGGILSQVRIGLRYKQSKVVQLDYITYNWKRVGIRSSWIKNMLEIKTK